jgi:ATP-dependent Lon protease
MRRVGNADPSVEVVPATTEEAPVPEAPTSGDTSRDGDAVRDRDVVSLPLLPLTTGVVLPQMVVTLALETDEARAAIAAALDGPRPDGSEGERLLLLVPRTDRGYASVGTIAKVEDSGSLPGRTPAVVVRGLHRARLGMALPGTGSALWVQAEPVPDPDRSELPATVDDLAREYRATVDAILEERGAGRLASGLRGVTDPGVLADTIAYSPDLAFERRVELLEALDVAERLGKALAWAKETLAELTLKERIRTEVTDGMEQRQREYVLRQQMEAIRKELGEGDDDVVGEYRAKVAELGDGLPEHIGTKLLAEIDRLERTGAQSPEHGWIRTWIETVLDLPWGVRTDDRHDVAEARAILDADHTGLDDVKDRIIEFLAVRKLRAERGLSDADAAGSGGRRQGGGAIVTLVGPPGVGKTSLGESIARALGRTFVRVSLGGIRDEAEIRGHRRTYVGARAGRIVAALTDAGSMNPVVLLDEVDKVGADWRGDPSSALLEVLDPAQNHTFRDHYLELDLDLSQVLFLATANVIDTIPGPLLDRMEIVSLDGYTEDEKVAIARDHLLARQRAATGLRDDEVVVTEAALREVVVDFTREAGVRTLERQLGKLMRKVATKIASGAVEPPVVVDAGGVREHLGRPRHPFEVEERTSEPGVATGLAVTGIGGDVLFVEATDLPGGDGGATTLHVTGQLGEVMQESAQIALSYVRSHADKLGIDPQALVGRRFHVHVPAGAVPKDGPSAGVTMVTALASLLTGRPVRPVVGMTGEVTLQGRVLPIGGVKQKVLAADRAGLTEVFLPERNGGDLDDVPEAVRERMTFHLARDVADVVALALAPAEQLAVAS